MDEEVPRVTDQAKSRHDNSPKISRRKEHPSPALRWHSLSPITHLDERSLPEVCFTLKRCGRSGNMGLLSRWAMYVYARENSEIASTGAKREKGFK